MSDNDNDQPDDCPPHDALDRAAEMAEMSYRRGFDQGVAAAIEAIFETDIDVYNVRCWKRRLSTWRRQSCKRVVFPEWLGRSWNP